MADPEVVDEWIRRANEDLAFASSCLPIPLLLVGAEGEGRFLYRRPRRGWLFNGGLLFLQELEAEEPGVEVALGE